MGFSLKNVAAELSPVYGALEGKGTFGDLLGKKSEMEAELAKKAEEQKAAQRQAAAQEWAKRSNMKKGGSVKSKRYDSGGSVYTEKMGKPPQDVDGASVRKQSKRDQPEQLGEGIRVEKKAKGGSVSASSRADGCACRGKTKGKMY